MVNQPRIGQAELEILHYVHDHQPVTVRQVADHLAQTKGVVRTTVLNVMTRLVRKGFLVRRKDGAVFKYSTRVGKAQHLRNLVRDFVDKTLEGSVSPFMAYLVQDARLSDEDRKQLKQLVRSLDQNRKPEARP
jgi:predicted transcriptional regulator